MGTAPGRTEIDETDECRLSFVVGRSKRRENQHHVTFRRSPRLLDIYLCVMASQPESRIPGPGGGYGGKEKRRSFLPAPKSYSGIPTPGLSSTSVVLSDYTAAPTLPSIKAPGSVKKDTFHEESQAVREEIPGASHLKINGKVTIGGVKPGILRYVGKTHIAPGFWCGVELFDASGLHDGEVDGRRYFSCKPFHGIFAPLDKVVPKPEEEPVKVRSFPPPAATQEQDEQKHDKKEDVELTALVTDLPERTSFGDPAGEPIQAKAASSGKSQIARLSSIPRIGPAEKVVKSISAESFLKDSADTPKAPVKSGLTRIAAFIRRDRPSSGQDVSHPLNSTFVVENQSGNKSSTSFDDLDLEGSLDENYIQRVEKKLQSDSRQYFNITFNKEGLPGPPHSASNLPDVVSSASPTPSPPSHSKIPGALNQTKSAQDIASAVASDMSLGLLEPDLLLDDTNLLDNLSGGERVVSSTSESDISLSGNSSTLEETSIAIADLCEGQTSTPLQGNNLRKLLGHKGVGVSNVDVQRSEDIAENETRTEEIRQNFSVVQDRYRDSDSSSSSGAAFPVKQELLQEEGSNGISPEVSQVLEWDYDHDAFDAKLLEKSQDGMSTSTSDSCSETSVDPLGPLAEKSVADLELPCNEMDESNQFEDNEDGFENIDSIEDFPIGMSKEAKHLMTDSGISEKDLKDFGDQTTDTVSNRRSVDFDVTVVIHPDQDIGAKSGSTGIHVTDENLSRDLANGHSKQERPLSLISTTSADTGYAPDTDSEAGTLTTNSPTDWTEKHQLSGQTVAAHSDVKAKGLGLMKRQPSGLQGLKENEVEVDGDLYSDTAVTVIDLEAEAPSEIDDLDRTDCPESGNSEKAGEEGEATDTSSSENEADERPEDDRVEADQPLIETSRTTGAGAAGESRESSQSDSITSQDAVQLNREMTESAEPVAPHDEEKEESDSTVKEITPTKSENGALADFDAGAISAQVVDENLERKENQRKDSKESESLDTSVHKKGKAVARKIVIEHKKVNVKAATSKLADYIKAPLPVKPKEEKTDAKQKKNSAANTGKGLKQQDTSPDNSSVASVPDKSKSDNLLTDEKKQTCAKEEKPKVKRATPKSKWGNIMSQIEANKDTKVKPKTEVKSSIAAYLSTPVPVLPVKKDKEDMPPPKPKLKIARHSKPDFSNVRSKLNISSSSAKPPSAQRDGEPDAQTKGDCTPRKGAPKVGGKLLMLDYNEKVDNWSIASATSSRTDLSVFDVTDSASPSPRQPDVEKKGNSASRAAPRLKGERPGSVASSRSDVSTAQRSVKAMNLKNAQKSDSRASEANQVKKSSAKSSIPPLTPRRAENKATPSTKQQPPPPHPPPPPPPPERAISASATRKPAITRAAEIKSGASSGRALPKRSTVTSNTSRLRNKVSSQLKSGQPPDVVSTSARGTQAQEVARLESLCEARTKDLNYTRMQLKAGLQAFDAMACLVNYCTQDLDAFSCPEVTAKLKLAEGKVLEQQEQLDGLQRQIGMAEEQILEIVKAKDTALEEVTKLKEEIEENEKAHAEAMKAMQEAHRESQTKLEEDLTAQHQQAIQQLQLYKEKQLERLHDSSRRQISELAAEHQMATNQLRVAHLEEIQELRNKHDMQMEELHEQHRNKLEDITRRFESIKICLSEKVESLCQECDDLRFRAKSSEEALQRDADTKVQLALAPYLHLPKEIESLRTVVDMRTEEIQRLRKQNMDLEKQLEELPIAQEKVLSLQQKVENLQAIISIKTDHEKQLHEKCQVLMRKYDRESRANKRLSMDYEQAMWRMSQSADFSLSSDGLNVRHLSHSPTRTDCQHGSPSPIRRSQSNTGQAGVDGDSAALVTRRQRKISGGDEDHSRRIRCRSATFVMEKSRTPKVNASHDCGTTHSGSSTNQLMTRSADSADIAEALSTDHNPSWNFGADDGDDAQSSLESSIVLEISRDFETPSGNVSYCVTVADEVSDDKEAHDDVFDGKSGVNSTVAATLETTITDFSGGNKMEVLEISSSSNTTTTAEPTITSSVGSS